MLSIKNLVHIRILIKKQHKTHIFFDIDQLGEESEEKGERKERDEEAQ